jgi:hypothetical protein
VLINGVNNLKLCYVMLSTSTYPACDIDNRSPFGSDFFRGGIRKENEIISSLDGEKRFSNTKRVDLE